jgi:2-keto-4-pentenoate hydratase/2-oxohepta-3-ene-1,7-dioic acid hydratase in catechol pathway
MRDEDPFSHVFGYTCLNDVTARDLQKVDGHFARAKGFDTFCPLGPVIETEIDTANLIVETHVNGEGRQRGSTADMIFDLDAIMRFLSGVMTLEPGDVIATGTPPGVGSLQVGDTVEVVIEGIGRLRNSIVAESGA